MHREILFRGYDPESEERVDVLEDLLVDLTEKLLELHDSLDGSYENMKHDRKRILSLVHNIQEVLVDA